MSGPASGQTPGSSISPQPSFTRSSIVKHRPWSPRGDDFGKDDKIYYEDSTRVDGLNPMVAKGGMSTNEFVPEPRKSIHSQRHRPRNSGGFLLETSILPGVQNDSLALEPVFQRGIAQDLQAIGTHRPGPKPPQKRKQSHHHHRLKASASLKRSPLTTEITNPTTQDGEYQVPQQASDADLISFAPSEGSHGDEPSTAGNIVDVLGKKTSEGMSKAGFAPEGLDTDLAQIVNLALDLSESRRQQQYPVSLIGNGGNTRRVVSAGQHSLAPGLGESYPSVGAGASLRQHLQQQRRIARNISPTPSNLHRLSSASHGHGTQRGRHASSGAALASPTAQQDQGAQYHLSSSTLARAEKAKIYMELSAEYRRTLSFLPRLKEEPVKSTIEPCTAHGSSTYAKADQSVPGMTSKCYGRLGLGRPYNPLQSIRNRRVRARERINIDMDLERWGHLGKVRVWVDSVEEQSTHDGFEAPQYVRLPPAPRLDQLDQHTHTDLLNYENQNKKSSTLRRKHPLIYWSITPPELFADTYWLEQGEHKTLIEDKDNKKIYHHDIHTTGRRSYEMTSSKSRNEVRDGATSSEDQINSVNRAQHATQSFSDDNTGRDRGRHRRQLQDTFRTRNARSASKRRRMGLHINTTRSLGSSRSSSSEGGNFRGSKKFNRSNTYEDDISSSVLEKQMMELLEREAQDSTENRLRAQKGTSIGEHEKAIISPKDAAGRAGEVHDRRELMGRTAGWKRVGLFRRSLDYDSKPKPATQDFDKGSKLGSTQNTTKAIISSTPPSLSVPSSRDGSPRRRPFSSDLSVYTGDRTKAKNAISENDFAINDSSTTQRARQQPLETGEDQALEPRKPRSWSPTKRLLPTKPAEDRVEHHRRSDSKGRIVVGDKDEEPTIRGIFRNVRIEQIVRNEVSKFGDLIWNKDSANNGSNFSTSPSSYVSGSSDSDEYDSASDHTLQRSEERLNKNHSEELVHGALGTKAPGYSAHKYHLDNLPTFASQRNRDRAARNQTIPEADHITRQQLEQRGVRRPSRFERLAPPRIDIRNVSPASSRDLSRTASRDTDELYDEPRHGNYGLGPRAGVVPFSAHQRVRNADMRLNAVLGLPGTVGRGGPPVTGLAGITSEHRPSSRRTSLYEKQEWSISNHAMPGSPARTNHREIARVKALLLSSGIKAKEISRRAYEIRDPPPLFLRRVCRPPLPRVPAGEEHVVAAQLLSQDLESTTSRLEGTVSAFSAGRLLDHIKSIQERIRSKLTPLVRASADDADAFSTELTTTHTLAIKQLNDSIDILLRRRRRRLRWIRRGGYVLLEWILLGVMWWVWLIVVIVRVGRGIVMTVVRGVRWVLWL